jgi:ribosomal protein S18 acetylase RimI-like enzyme
MADEMKVNIRQATLKDALGIARVHLSSWQTTYQGIVPDRILRKKRGQKALLEGKSRALQILKQKGGRRSDLVAETSAGRIVGWVSSGANRGKPGRYDAEIYALYLVQSAQGKGIGKALVLAAVKRLTKSGYRSLVIWALEKNKAVGFYRKLGGKLVMKKDSVIGKPLVSVAFGWKNLAALVGVLESGSVKIRKASHADFAGYKNLSAMGDELHHKSLPGVFTHAKKAGRSKEHFLTTFGKADREIYVAESGNKLVGFVQASLGQANNPILVPVKYAYVHDIVVAPAWQEKGIGQKLMEEARKWAKEGGAKQMRLQVWEFNRGAARFYDRLGFKPVSRHLWKDL